MIYIFDACAILAYYKGEKGSDKIKTLIDEALANQSAIYIHSINLIEVYYHFLRTLGKDKAEIILEEMYKLPMTTVDFIDAVIFSEVTADKAYITIQFPVPAEIQSNPKAANKKIGMTRKELGEFLKNAHTPHSDALSGLLSGVGDIAVEQIREERLAGKYPEYFK